MAGRLNRFLKLERRRPEGAGEPRPPVSRRRFEPESDRTAAGAPPEPGPPGEADPEARAGMMDERLEELRRERRRQLESGVALDDRQDSEQPFLRCARCEQDNHRFATRCQTCGADLTLDEQRTFNARLWAERRDQASREEAELARFHAVSAAASAPASGTRELGEALAQQVADRENRRLAWMDDGAVDARRALGPRLLKSIPNPGLRFAASLGLLALFLVLGYLSVRALGTGDRFSIAQVLFFALLMLFLPRRRRWRGPWGTWFFDD